MAHGRYTGTMGDIGVFSLNVHKPIQCGEGGMITTDDDDLADRMRAFINHGENPISAKHAEIRGLNLRMPEVCAAISSSGMQPMRWASTTRGASSCKTSLTHFQNPLRPVVGSLLDGRPPGPPRSFAASDRPNFHRAAIRSSLIGRMSSML